MTYKTLDHSDDEGKYRESNDINVVSLESGEVVHTPPDFKEVPELMDELFSFFNFDLTFLW